MESKDHLSLFGSYGTPCAWKGLYWIIYMYLFLRKDKYSRNSINMQLESDIEINGYFSFSACLRFISVKGVSNTVSPGFSENSFICKQCWDTGKWSSEEEVCEGFPSSMQILIGMQHIRACQMISIKLIIKQQDKSFEFYFPMY